VDSRLRPQGRGEGREGGRGEGGELVRTWSRSRRRARVRVDAWSRLRGRPGVCADAGDIPLGNFITDATVRLSHG
jgi:hypothetical protein